ncbi:hypothetical protein KR093_010637 [Drosophila rubida]|uniref:Protein enhancer of rudimentary n=1 Tax=Drosophila rubida TaxID=30044 RepID=A0AAD4JVK0_9MUSC|nr:hypothetical protein KR093_010637 [Drosophila rubida]
MGHTILLVQPEKRVISRTFCDYETVHECMEGICKIYEEHLKLQKPYSSLITYDIRELFDFIDTLADISCLVYEKASNSYQPHNKAWIKEQIYLSLRQSSYGLDKHN